MPTKKDPESEFYGSLLDDKVNKIKEDSDEKISQVNLIMIGVVLFIVITFIIEIYHTNADRIKDKDMYLQYTQMYKDYFDESSELKEVVNNELLIIKDLENKLETLKARNPYLK